MNPITTFVTRRLIHDLQAGNLTIVVTRDRRRGHLRYHLSNGKRVYSQTVEVMKEMGLLEQVESTEEANAKNEVHYRLRVQP